MVFRRGRCGGGFGGFWGDHMVFRGEDGGVRRILGRSHGFQREKKGGGGNRSSPTESKGGILENRLPPIFPIPLDEKNDQSSSLHLLFSIYK